MASHSQGSQSHSHHRRHRHHHHHHCPHCPLRPHCQHCPLFHANNYFFQPPTLPNSHAVRSQQLPLSSHLPISQELEHPELDGEEEDDEPVFVLTDEWRDFFAKSEARRKQERKQGKKGKK